MKDESIRKLEDNLQSMENKAKGKDNIHRNLHEKIKELEGQVELKTSMQNQSEKQISQLSEKLKGKEETCTALQQKVKELEKKLKEQLQSETASFQQKVWDLERRLKDQLQGSESESAILKDKIKELERKLKEQEQNSESLLRQQIKELEDSYREREQQWQQQEASCFVEAGKATPDVGKSRMSGGSEYPVESEPRILKSSNSVNRPTSQPSANQMRIKREFRGNEAENNYGIPTSLHERRVTRKSDPPRVARIVRPTTKPMIPAQAAPVSHKRASTSRDQVQGIKERETKKKIWSR
ncbi:hypothetical protein PIB30_045934 [Stylosanthes scabra]|uniref:Uncharacterized protein n=1 Tax=Stylosanthes scabra TaxID=79078 RepID=A0ABU6ZF28_9FABA|nr:hypothetical protein [Stylosanthes scabra]